MEPELRDIIVETATKVEGIEKSQKETWGAISEIRTDVQETKITLGKINWLPKAVMGIIMAIVGRALWIIAGK